MILFDFAVVQDRGEFLYVTNVIQNTEEQLTSSDEFLVRLSKLASEQIKEAIADKQVVLINKKDYSESEVTPSDYNVINVDQNALKLQISTSLSKVRMIVTPEMSKISGFALYGFMILNNDLCNEGYYITNENREEVYIKILETGDEELISKLEDYLNYKDELERKFYLERRFSKFKKRIMKATTVEQVEQLENDFLSSYYVDY